MGNVETGSSHKQKIKNSFPIGVLRHKSWGLWHWLYHI